FSFATANRRRRRQAINSLNSLIDYLLRRQLITLETIVSDNPGITVLCAGAVFEQHSIVITKNGCLDVSQIPGGGLTELIVRRITRADRVIDVVVLSFNLCCLRFQRFHLLLRIFLSQQVYLVVLFYPERLLQRSLTCR